MSDLPDKVRLPAGIDISLSALAAIREELEHHPLVRVGSKCRRCGEAVGWDCNSGCADPACPLPEIDA